MWDVAPSHGAKQRTKLMNHGTFAASSTSYPPQHLDSMFSSHFGIVWCDAFPIAALESFEQHGSIKLAQGS